MLQPLFYKALLYSPNEKTPFVYSAHHTREAAEKMLRSWLEWIPEAIGEIHLVTEG